MAKLKTAAQNLNERLGADCKFPILGTFEPITGIDLLLQDMEMLLLTLPGERVNRPEFGCYLRTMVWENLDTVAERGAASIRAALVNFEPRITVVNITSDVNNNTGLVVFNIKFVINATDTTANLIFPFRVGTALSFA